MEYYKIITGSLKDISSFSDKEHVLEDCESGDKIAIIDVKDDAIIKKIEGTNKIEADRFYITNLYEILNIDTLLYLYYNDVNLRAGNDALIKKAREKERQDIVRWLNQLFY